MSDEKDEILKELKRKVKVNPIDFSNELHKERFYELMKEDNANPSDNERKALFYIISGNEELYIQRKKVYNFINHQIELENYLEGKIMLSGGTSKMIYLGYHLYNGFSFKKIDANRINDDLSINDIFGGLDLENYPICINAINIRFNRIK